MKMVATEIEGAVVIEVEPIEDARGYFARIWDDREFAAIGMTTPWRQANVGYSKRAATVRGMHYQRPPSAEWKLIRCTRGSVFDVAVDLRPTSPSCRKWTAHELTADNGRMLLIPEGCAHGYMTLEDGSEIIYLTSAAYAPDVATGVRWDDAQFGVQWPMAPLVISEQDASWPDWRPSHEGGNE